jgi:iron complex outermembrane receptor protein
VWFSFPVYKFRQQDAHLFGGEAVAIYHPAALPGWEIKEVFSYTRGLLGDSGNLPFIPAPRLATTLRYDGTINNGRTKIFAAPEFVYVAAQQNTALFETTTGSYTLFNLSAGLIMPASGWTFGLNINNITNAVYADHLSRLKYYGLYNQGINFVVTVRREIKW